MKYKSIDKSKIHSFIYSFLSIFSAKGKKECKEIFLHSMLSNLKNSTKQDPFFILHSVLSKLNILCDIKFVKIGTINYKIAISIKKKNKRRITCKTLMFNVKNAYIGHNFCDKMIKEIILSFDSSSKTLKSIENIYSSVEFSKTLFYNKT